MFTIDLIIGTEDLDNEDRMHIHRESMDEGARHHNPAAKFSKEEIMPYVVLIHAPGQARPKAAPETEDSRRYRVLRRHYDLP
jgi:hypothetical protein